MTQNPSVSAELLLPPAQSAGTLCAPVVPQPGVLGPVSLPTSEQVSCGESSSHGRLHPCWEGRVCHPYPPAAKHFTPGHMTRHRIYLFGGLLTSAASSGYAPPARKSLHTRCLTTWFLSSSSSTVSPLPWRGQTLTRAAL